MAITTARSSEPVRGYYVTTIHTGRVVQASGNGFGLPRLGGLLYAQVEGLTGGSAASRMAAQAPNPSHEDLKVAKAEEKARVEDHREWKEDIKAAAKHQAAEEKKDVEVQKKVAEEAKKVDHPEVKPTAEVVKDPVTHGPRVVAHDSVVADDLNHPREVKVKEEKKNG